MIGRDDSYSLTGAYDKKNKTDTENEKKCGCAFEKTDTDYVKYDIVVANILADVIIPLSAVIRPYIKDNGYYITSGIIKEKEAAVKEALVANGFEIIDVVRMNDWVSVVAKP